MKFNLKKPCNNCPFTRKSTEGWLGEDRASEFADAIYSLDSTFSCHKTLSIDDEGDTHEHKDSQHCAGAMILLEKMGKPNQMMRISERLGLYNHKELDMSSDVFDDLEEFITHHS